jgi:hypothetical protein
MRRVATVLLLVLAATGCSHASTAVHTVVVPTTTTAPAALPPAATDLEVAKVVSLTRTDLPAGWEATDPARRCITASTPRSPGPGCGDDQHTEDVTTAACVGVPVARLGFVLGNDEPGEPFTYSSASFSDTAATSSDGGPPTAQTTFMVAPSAATARADMAALQRPSLADCMRALETKEMGGPWPGATVTVTPLAGGATAPGVSLAAVRLRLAGTVDKHTFSETGDAYILASGRYEMTLEIEGATPGVTQHVLAQIGRRLAKAGHG